MMQGKESERLRTAYAGDSNSSWLRWGPYVSERQWGTVREDYSASGDAWDYFSHDQARSRAYRWGEDGLAGICDEGQNLCFALALWNHRDPIIKERLFGLTNGEGNHGEDVKEYYYYLDNTPTHSYMKWLYKYPQQPYPYTDLVAENARRKRTDPHALEYELIDTGVFDDDRYFDVEVEYAKVAPEDVLIKVLVTNRGPENASLQLLPTLWFRNTWSWFETAEKPEIEGKHGGSGGGTSTLQATPAKDSDDIGPMVLYCQGPDELLFVDNETNNARLWGSENTTAYPKDGVNDYIVSGLQTVNPAMTGTKASAVYSLEIGAGETKEVRLRLSSNLALSDPFGADFDAGFEARIADADEFYGALIPSELDDDQRSIQRQAYAGMLWSKQFYYYIVADWLEGDPAQPPPPPERSRNSSWNHFYASNILTMPDVWEYPWFASWDLCFQTVVFAHLDVEFAKEQLLILAHEWYMSPDGAVPAYEWAFSDVNPPLHAWAALRIFAIEKDLQGGDGDIDFLADIFQYCLVYFTWWANRKDSDNRGLFEGGFLGLDNISVINRSDIAALEASLGTSVELYQSDGTSWMGMFSLNIMTMALTLCEAGRTEYAHLAVKYFQQFVYIADALNSIEHRSGGQVRLWDDADGFYYDVLKVSGKYSGDPDRYYSIKLRSLVGLITLFPVHCLDLTKLEKGVADQMKERIDWFIRQHPELLGQSKSQDDTGEEANQDKHLLAFVQPDRLKLILSRMLDQAEFLSSYGIRSLSRSHRDLPYTLTINGASFSAQYEPAESSVDTFGGNSNWRGPIWFPINFLLLESLIHYHEFLGDDFTVEYPTGSGEQHNLRWVAEDLGKRLVSIFRRGSDGRRPVFGGADTFQTNPHFRDHLLFYEYFHGDIGAGVGASHQTGWTGLVTELLRGLSVTKGID